MNQRQTRTYDREFKLNAVKLYHSSGKSYDQISDELGIPSSTLVHWVHSHRKDGAESFPGKGFLKESDAELSQLRKELAIAREERDILKNRLNEPPRVSWRLFSLSHASDHPGLAPRVSPAIKDGIIEHLLGGSARFYCTKPSSTLVSFNDERFTQNRSSHLTVIGSALLYDLVGARYQ